MIVNQLIRPNIQRFLFSLSLLAVCVAPVYSQPNKPEAYLRFQQPTPGTRNYYVAVYMKEPLVGGIDQIRASLREVSAVKKLISTTVELPPPGDDSTFTFRLGLSEQDVFRQLPGYRVYIDVYPTAQGAQDHEVNVSLDVTVKLDARAGQCLQQTSIQLERISDTKYGRDRLSAMESYLSKSEINTLISASVIKVPKPPQPRDVRSVSKPSAGKNVPDAPFRISCISFVEAPPPGDYSLSLTFDPGAPGEPGPPPELLRAVLKGTGNGPQVPNPTAAKRDLEDFLDLGLSLTSSVQEVQTGRARTTRGVSDLFFAPILNLRKVGTLGADGGVVQIFTPFYIDSKVSTGKITKDTLALNRIELGSTYEFRHFLNTHAYPDLMRHALSFKHNSDRDFKRDEFKFTYEFQPIFGAINQPIGSAPELLRGEIIPDPDDKFGIEIVPILGVELGRTYRVKNPKEFEGISRNVRRFYFGSRMAFDFTRYVRLALEDRFYVRGENPKDRTENYFIGTVEAPLGRIGNLRAAHALFFSFERGEQPPFNNPSVNILKFGYRIRARGLLIDLR